MKTEWDYTTLATPYLKRPDYSDPAVDAMLKIAGLTIGNICDVGAGVAHLTLMLLNRGFTVSAVEPNDAMRKLGSQRTSKFSSVSWDDGIGENTGQESSTFDLVTFGSSFNVCDQNKALLESARILKPQGWFACMWNHRDLSEKIQNNIEKIISKNIPDYSYGSRRIDQTPIILASGLFKEPIKIESRVMHKQSMEDCIEAWRSHATLKRQASKKFPAIISEIEKYLINMNVATIDIPYSTNIWLAQLK